MVSPQDIAASAVIMLTGAGHEGKQYTLTGTETLSFDKVAYTFQEIMGREVRYIQVPREAAIAQLVGRGQSAWLAGAIISMLPPSSLINSTVIELTGRAPLTLSQCVKGKLKTAN